MLLFVIVIFSFIKGILFFAVGAAAALVLWLVCRVFGLQVPDWIRWGGVALLLLIASCTVGSDLLPLSPASEPSAQSEEGWGRTRFWSDLLCGYVALFALTGIGLLASFIRASNAALLKRRNTPPPLAS